ncbi:MAG: DUF4172 domain-containing protein [Cyanobacteria bacterium]|nr:DUF4172 domain-containing protein [Cyanobacteriota bacterium]
MRPPEPWRGLRVADPQGACGEEPLLEQARAARQELLSRLETLEPPLDREAISALLGRESLGTAAIEGELLDPGQVRSSIARRLRLPLAGEQPAASAQVEGLLDVLLEATSTLDQPLTLATLNHWHQRLFSAGPDAGGLPPFFCTGCTDGQIVDINGWLRNGCVRQHQDERFRANPTAPPRTSCSTPAAQSARFSGMGRKKLRSRMAAEKAAITPIKPTAFPSSLCLCLRSSGCSALLTSTPPVSSWSDLKSALGSLIQMLTRVSRWSSLTNWRVDPPSSRSLTSR